MYIVYILKDKRGRLYKGMTNNIERRLSEHIRGKTVTTRRMDCPRLIYKEEYIDLKSARKRELYLKTAAGRRFVKNLGI